MTQQGDNWWDKLYDESAPDTAPTATGDSLDDRFDSASQATAGAARQGAGDPVGPAAPAAPPPPSAPRAPWEPPDAAGPAPRSFPAPPPVPPPDAPSAATLPATPRHAPTAGASTPPALPDGSPTGGPPTASSPPSPEGPPSLGRAMPPTGPEAHVPAAGPAPADLPARPGSPAASAPPARPEAHAPEAHAPDGGPAPVVPSPQLEDHEPKAGPAAVPRPRTAHIGNRPPTYEPEPTALPVARPGELGELVADTVLDGARYGAYTLRAASQRGDSARYRGEPRRDALLTARFGHEEAALVLVAVASGARAAEGAHLAAADACRWIGEAVGRSHARLSEDIRSGRRGDLKSGLHRLTDRTYGKLRARAAELGVEPEEYTAGLRCLLLSADPDCRTRVFFGMGAGGLFRLRDGAWQDIEPLLPEPAALTGAPVVASEARWGSPRPEAGGGSRPSETEEGDRLTMRLGVTSPPGAPPPAEPFRFRASVARPGDTLLLASNGLAEPMRGEPALAKELAARWAAPEPPGLAAFLADTQLRVKGYADDRTGVAVWEA